MRSAPSSIDTQLAHDNIYDTDDACPVRVEIYLRCATSAPRWRAHSRASLRDDSFGTPIIHHGDTRIYRGKRKAKPRPFYSFLFYLL